ncbi:hypothetical protein POX_h09474 [Penicillium oxalicum]|uniref:hypothetical protein n=1 Tax=Penicillium oxalicum TaxID=69781 RepID=UPI0020B71215|nr:hypothetical protein POX_h09474 [Penicillium oxalicum]KAI2785716.1 hypothetical protein POX_h09474 [Penicillium oxalicum]
MGIPMWREPSEVDALKTLEKDATAAGRSSIRRSNATRSQTFARARRMMSSFHSQMLEEIQRGATESRVPVRSPVLNLGVSEDGMDLETSRREAMGLPTTRSESQRRSEQVGRRSSAAREFTDFLAARAGVQARRAIQSRNSSRAHLTPGFAPAMSHHMSASPDPSSPHLQLSAIALPAMRSSAHRDHSDNSTPPTAPLPGYRPTLPSSLGPRDSPVDGLEDRQRSLSPDPTGENDVWETFLTTMAPDVDGPSSHASISSNRATEGRRNAAVLASAMLPSQSGQSRAVQLALDPYPNPLQPCDFSSSDEDGDDNTPANYHRYARPSGNRSSLGRSAGLHSTMSNHPPVSTIALSFPDPSSPDLQQMRSILDRLARREDIPDDWWAGAGLSRSLGRDLGGNADTRDHADGS